MKFVGKKVLITGAAAGIGQAIATRFVDAGASVACVDINAAALRQTILTLQNRPGKAIGIRADVGSPRDIDHAVNDAIQQLQGLDILINNAGINLGGSVDDVSLEDWHKVMAVNLTSIFLLTKSVWLRFTQQRHGVIVNMSSIMGLTGARNSFAYCASKAGIIGLTKSTAADGASLGIRVNCVCPGYVITPIMDAAHTPESMEKISRQIPIKRMASAEEIASGVVYLSSDDASYASGTVLVLDGAATIGFAGCHMDDSDT